MSKKLTKKTVRTGDTVTCKLFGGERYTGVVESIEICQGDTKYGRYVNTCNIDKHDNGVISMPDHWCYFNQVISVQHKLSQKEKWDEDKSI